MEKKRLDVLLVERGLCESREKAQALILAGEVFGSQGQRLEKPGTAYPVDIEIELKSRSLPFKSRAGQKLQFALDRFHISATDKVCMDVGASTGGFTHCLLKNGASHVVAIDVGYGQLDVELRNHPQVINLEKTNARHLTKEVLGEWGTKVELAVVDVSFISIEKVIEPLAKEFPSLKEWVLLFKPQFEVGPENLGKKGKVKNEEAVQKSLQKFEDWMREQGFKKNGGPETSPLPGKKSGNLEYLFFYER
ncbi:MAG: TlyA family RNA methyltransferase [Proteobacteria bacterium]|nr:TlyA family RNA methyltransferase [Pseudomonadota bacterium]